MAQLLNSENFADFVSGSAVPVLVEFYRDGCIPCRRVAPLLSKAGEAYGDRLAIARVNIGQNAGLAAQFQVEAAPTLLLFQDGKEQVRHRGVIDRGGLEALLQSVLLSSESI